MKKITLLAAAFAFSFGAVAQTVVIDRPADSTQGLISSNGDNDAGVFCAELIELDSDVVLGTIAVEGFSSTGLALEPSMSGLDFFIYEDDGDVPASNPSFAGEALVDLPGIAVGGGGFDFFDDGAGGVPNNFRINVTAANGGTQVTLPAGNYWVVVAPAGAGDSAGDVRWNWLGNLGSPSSVEPYLIDTDDLFGAGATNWTNIAGLIGEAFPALNVTVTDEALGLGDNDLTGVAVYPNPAQDVLNVTLPSNVEVNSATLIDVLGKTTGASLENGQMNIADLAAGVYILNLDTNLGSFSQKVIKQ
ncbi:T9SS type A sorting domain-containing protein [Patiriisocius marinus]|uniref:Secretion system C-terminal sorting domain-containing protein n=1 Tax=Patiriisocius marinus TaxID=1397112 RepID=A0A5J4IPV4_9FLAO|nr:T9SS type A sorting domain-containing protein [Patiriisocius marinus]GER59769.1 hypothetical protein ULMA_18770 [Patiriisocius marinus]